MSKENVKRAFWYSPLSFSIKPKHFIILNKQLSMISSASEILTSNYSKTEDLSTLSVPSLLIKFLWKWKTNHIIHCLIHLCFLLFNKLDLVYLLCLSQILISLKPIFTLFFHFHSFMYPLMSENSNSSPPFAFSSTWKCFPPFCCSNSLNQFCFVIHVQIQSTHNLGLDWDFWEWYRFWYHYHILRCHFFFFLPFVFSLFYFLLLHLIIFNMLPMATKLNSQPINGTWFLV